jgi:hypothetical protein
VLSTNATGKFDPFQEKNSGGGGRERKNLRQVSQLEAISWANFRLFAENKKKTRGFPVNNDFFAIFSPICS